MPVIPMAPRGLWGSFFSHKGGPALKRGGPACSGPGLELVVGEPVAPETVTAEGLHSEVAELRGDKR